MDIVYGSIINDIIKCFKLIRFNFLFWFSSSYLHFIDIKAMYLKKKKKQKKNSLDKHWVNCTEKVSAFSFIVTVQSFSCVQLFATLWTAAHQASLSTISWSLLKLMSIELVIPSNHLILCHPLFLLPLIFPSIKVFSQWVSSPHQVAKVLELQL